MLKHYKLLVVALVIVGACANPVAPTGGPRDTDPPVVLRAEPDNSSINFDATEIRIWFDEFIQLRGLQQEFLSSPPFKKVPDVRIRGKSVVIKLEEELRSQTTYTLFFGNSISDLNEGNALAGFRYIFSTGPVLDSMELKGRLFNAMTQAPEKDVFIMLYDIYKDSIPMQERPYYIARTDKDGHFAFTNLRNIPYKVFALRDVNANLIYDLPNEEIAFKDSLIWPFAPPRKPAVADISENGLLPENAEEIEGLDELLTDESILDGDSITTQIKPHSLKLFLFNEVDSTQRIEKAEYLHPDRLQFIFRFPVKEFQLNPIPEIEEPWFIPEALPRGDTLWYWLSGLERDTLVFEVSALKMKTDTLRIPLTRFNTFRHERLLDTVMPSLTVQHNIARTGPAHLHQPLRLVFSEPIQAFDTARIELLQDSVPVSANIYFEDEIRRRLLIDYPWQDTTFYNVLIPDKVFSGIYGHTNDTLSLRFKTRARSDYAGLTLRLNHNFVHGQLIIELLDGQNRPIRRKVENIETETLLFDFLMPGKYKIRVIHDANANGQWDTGVYLSGLQPERVYMFDLSSDLRANWDIEELLDFAEKPMP